MDWSGSSCVTDIGCDDSTSVTGVEFAQIEREQTLNAPEEEECDGKPCEEGLAQVSDDDDEGFLGLDNPMILAQVSSEFGAIDCAHGDPFCDPQ